MEIMSDSCSHTLKIICFFMLILVGKTSSQNSRCPFQYLYHFGDGVTDIGNSIHVRPKDPNPARFSPYGITYPGWPTGRWCDGLVDFDYTAADFGLPNIVPYLTSPASTSNDGVIFSVARSPVLPLSFFEARGINIPSYAVPLHTQMAWFRKYLKTVCSTNKECADRLANSLVLMGDIEGNDVGYALTQGKSIEEVKTYVPEIVQTLINATRVLIKLGAARLIIPGNGPLGCYPYILTALWTVDPAAYDELGCLRSVNELVAYKNDVLQTALENLQNEFPNIFISYSPMYSGLWSVINDTSVIGPDGINKALKSCCGIGGRYNYDSNRFCGSSPAVPVCSNPNEYIYWDGLHFTQQVYYKMEHMLVLPALVNLNCTTSSGLQSYTASSLSANL